MSLFPVESGWNTRDATVLDGYLGREFMPFLAMHGLKIKEEEEMFYFQIVTSLTLSHDGLDLILQVRDSEQRQMSLLLTEEFQPVVVLANASITNRQNAAMRQISKLCT
jgi:hypothetical protein